MGALSSNFNENPELASRPYDKSRDGFVISGGSGILILEDEEHAKKRNARSSGSFTGVLNLITDSAPTNPRDRAKDDLTIKITKEKTNTADLQSKKWVKKCALEKEIVPPKPAASVTKVIARLALFAIVFVKKAKHAS